MRSGVKALPSPFFTPCVFKLWPFSCLPKLKKRTWLHSNHPLMSRFRNVSPSRYLGRPRPTRFQPTDFFIFVTRSHGAGAAGGLLLLLFDFTHHQGRTTRSLSRACRRDETILKTLLCWTRCDPGSIKFVSRFSRLISNLSPGLQPQPRLSDSRPFPCFLGAHPTSPTPPFPNTVRSH
jgi:hypothetical protein